MNRPTTFRDEPIILLAAGASSRMGGEDKLLRMVDGRPLLRRQAEAALGTGAPVHVALPAEPGARSEALDGLDVIAVPCPTAQHGLAATLRSMVGQLPACSAFMVLPADLVDLGTEDLVAVYEARIQNRGHLIWRGATPEGKGGHPVLFDARLRRHFAMLSGDAGAAPIIQTNANRCFSVLFEDDRALRDLDTPADWAAWEASRDPQQVIDLSLRAGTR